ncbi:hypothetical protein GCK72_001358 [Caenorhabditis remanei]|uniref:Uncharacterized protein n=1 Tax=Caenorhabditis remanei TaxID=31234 RepID=A0A6A5HQN2_CAERE|nr:hypothetical protein GCK72_001358 [Caenorhabditis remanei]KAF1769541.1 hypothetical protein GCK72_001358 [Caenorhabditis remanei]
MKSVSSKRSQYISRRVVEQKEEGIDGTFLEIVMGEINKETTRMRYLQWVMVICFVLLAISTNESLACIGGGGGCCMTSGCPNPCAGFGKK